MARPGQHRVLRLLLLALVTTRCAANRGRGGRGPGGSGIGESGESELQPRPGTHCQLLSREVLTVADATTTPSTLAVHRLRFALPAAFRTPGCCDGENGMLHVRVKAPDANGKMLVRPYSAHMHPANQTFELVVKAYPGGVSEKLCALPVDAYAHVPEIRALDWRRDSKRVGMVCFGVGITECLGPAEALLKAGAEVAGRLSNQGTKDPPIYRQGIGWAALHVRRALSRPVPYLARWAGAPRVLQPQRGADHSARRGSCPPARVPWQLPAAALPLPAGRGRCGAGCDQGRQGGGRDNPHPHPKPNLSPNPSPSPKPKPNPSPNREPGPNPHPHPNPDSNQARRRARS